MPKMTRSLLRAALLASLAMPATALVPEAIPFVTVKKAHAGLLAEHRDVLAQYGTFQPHGKYGEVWIPTVTPQGWHPYPPCHWVYTKHGWHFDDPTPWGKIVHHFGRWTHDGSTWLWVPGEEYSPGWVVWKASQDWVGWAPTPPEQDMKTLDQQAFNSDKMWIFMDAKKFGKSCDGGIAPTAQVPQLLTQTQYIRDVAVVDGMVVFVFPSWLIGPIVDIDIWNINVWSPIFIVNVINIWNIVWNVNIINIACSQQNVQPVMAPPTLPSNPPPPPGRRTELPPTTPPGGGNNPPGGYNPPGGNTPPGGYNPPGGRTPPGGYNPPGGYVPPRTWIPPTYPPGGGGNYPPRNPGSAGTPGGGNTPGAGNGTGPGRPTGPNYPSAGNGNQTGGTSGLTPIRPINPGLGRIPNLSNLPTGNRQVGSGLPTGRRLVSPNLTTGGGNRGNLSLGNSNAAAAGKYRLR